MCVRLSSSNVDNNDRQTMSNHTSWYWHSFGWRVEHYTNKLNTFLIRSMCAAYFLTVRFFCSAQHAHTHTLRTEWALVEFQISVFLKIHKLKWTDRGKEWAVSPCRRVRMTYAGLSDDSHFLFAPKHQFQWTEIKMILPQLREFMRKAGNLLAKQLASMPCCDARTERRFPGYMYVAWATLFVQVLHSQNICMFCWYTSSCRFHAFRIHKKKAKYSENSSTTIITNVVVLNLLCERIVNFRLKPDSNAGFRWQFAFTKGNNHRCTTLDKTILSHNMYYSYIKHRSKPDIETDLNLFG